ncbi:MAG TPA: 16S rRNA (uracil(1498)-N(3))-methyltransferase [Actinomycetes bacterium]
MSAPVFLVDDGRLDDGDRVVLDGPEGRHAATVRRLGPGERVLLSDGRGLVADCRVLAAGRDHLELEVCGRSLIPAPQPRLVVVQALPKGDRGELAVETMTEVGVDVVVPWAAARCITRWRADRADKALARWRSAAREAAKQARRPHVPEVTAVAGTDQVAARLRSAALGVVLHEEADLPLAALDVPRSGDVVVVVGPEGGVSPAELEEFDRAGATAYRLGPTVLRTSTAGVAALSVLSALSGRWDAPGQ